MAAPSSSQPNRAWTWLASNLFSSPLNSALTLLIMLVLALLVPKLLSWAIVNAVFAPDPQACRAAKGACWGFIVEKFRLMTFGTYPYDQQWRPLAVMGIMLGLIGSTMRLSWWGRPLWIAWAFGVPVMWLLMRGGTVHLPVRLLIYAGLIFGLVRLARRFGLLDWRMLGAAAIALIFVVLHPFDVLWKAAIPIPTGLSLVETDKWGGLPLTLILSANGIVFSFPLAVVLALGRRSELPVIRALSVGYIELVRGVPLITVLFMASLMIPLFLPEGVTIDKLLRAQIGFILFAAAYEAEVIRGGLQAVPKGQYEAADALGLSYWQKMSLIVLPQALKVVIPPMVNTFIGFFKDTSLVIIIGLFDLLGAVRLASSDVEWRVFYVEGLVFVALVYFAFCYAMAVYARRLEERLDKSTGR
jgi:general L-amino acid transport system permease protein